MNISEKLANIRNLMLEKGIDAYIIPSSDPHISEYLPDRFKVIQWTSGFTGSAGTLVITQKFAGLWTDFRYFVQANEQLQDTGFELVPLKAQNSPEYISWLSETLPSGARISFDGKLASQFLANLIQNELEPLGYDVKGDVDLHEEVWENRPNLPKNKAFLLTEEQTGQSRIAKIDDIRRVLKSKRANTTIVSSLDDIAWIFNIRGNDVHCNPVVLGFAKITLDECILYIDKEKISVEESALLQSEGIFIKTYESIWDDAAQLDESTILLYDSKRTCHSLFTCFPIGIKKIDQLNPSTHLKSIKNPVEIEFTRKAMQQDGVALTKFFIWLESEIDKGNTTLTEISIAEKLTSFRSERPGYKGDSFDTIAGYKEHGALPHYKATAESNSVLKAEGLLLIDSGGQYVTGTTDITRVISLGQITEDEKRDYTLVLKGMIEGSTTLFPENTRGYQIDAITRKPLWDYEKNYGHGTGHGVGFFLNVHEGPHVFNAAAIDIPVHKGTITSIEPGLYLEGKYGIRIENLVLCQEHSSNFFGNFLSFETLTLCYIDTQLIDKKYLDESHINWLNEYNSRVFNEISEYLGKDEQEWLKHKTAKI